MAILTAAEKCIWKWTLNDDDDDANVGSTLIPLCSAIDKHNDQLKEVKIKKQNEHLSF